MIDPKNGAKEKLAALPKILGYYAGWYPPLWLRGLSSRTKYADFGPLAGHLRFVERSARKLARASFHGMSIYQAKMERKQGFLFRCVDVVMELFAMSATISHARRMMDDRSPDAANGVELADLFCRGARRRVERFFRDLWRNEDGLKNRVAANVMNGKHQWLERGHMDMGFTPESFKTRSITAQGAAPAEKPKIAAAGS